MGTLKPDTKYIYERDGKKVYAREFGSTERRLVGYDYDGSGRNLDQGLEQLEEDQLWAEIRQAAKHNPALKYALDQAKVIHQLSKKTNEV